MYCHEQYYTHAGYYSTDSIDYEQYEHNDIDVFSDEHQCDSRHGSELSVEWGKHAHHSS
jgi:hypothetical protein